MPIGDAVFIHDHMSTKTDQIVAKISKISTLLQNVSAQGLYAMASYCLAPLLQYEGQRTVPAAAAQPIYAAAPLLTAMWSFVVLHEPITQFEALGGLGVFGAAALATSSGGGAATGEVAPLLPLSMEATTENAGGNEDGA
jgi:drug/metabolite transporter (DMT)-like permease